MSMQVTYHISSTHAARKWLLVRSRCLETLAPGQAGCLPCLLPPLRTIPLILGLQLSLLKLEKATVMKVVHEFH
jgi:hypothetical protein